MPKLKTTEAVKAGDATGTLPEFGRTIDVQRLYGLKRGSLYNLHQDGKIKGVVLRCRGEKSGIRLWHLKSIRDYIYSEMEPRRPTAKEGQQEAAA